MKKNLLKALALLLLLAWVSVLAGSRYEADNDDVLYELLSDTKLSADSVEIVLQLPRSLVTDWANDNVGAAYLALAPGLEAAAIVRVDDKCFEVQMLFNHSHLRRKK